MGLFDFLKADKPNNRLDINSGLAECRNIQGSERVENLWNAAFRAVSMCRCKIFSLLVHMCQNWTRRFISIAGQARDRRLLQAS